MHDALGNKLHQPYNHSISVHMGCKMLCSIEDRCNVKQDMQARRDRLTAVAVCKKSVWEMLNDAYHLARVATKSSEETSGINTMDCLQLSAIPSGLLMCDDSG